MSSPLRFSLSLPLVVGFLTLDDLLMRVTYFALCASGTCYAPYVLDCFARVAVVSFAFSVKGSEAFSHKVCQRRCCFRCFSCVCANCSVSDIWAVHVLAGAFAC